MSSIKLYYFCKDLIKQTFKYLFVLVLCLLVTLPMCLSFMVYYQQLRAIKKEVKTELIANTLKEDLVSFQFDMGDNDFQNLYWHHSHEFALEGKMFDIVEADTVNNQVYYLCFPDKQETALNHKFKNHLKDRFAKDKDKENKSVQICAIFLSLYKQNYQLLLPQVNFNKPIRNPKYQMDYSEPDLDSFGPPPEYFV